MAALHAESRESNAGLYVARVAQINFSAQIFPVIAGCAGTAILHVFTAHALLGRPNSQITLAYRGTLGIGAHGAIAKNLSGGP